MIRAIRPLLRGSTYSGVLLASFGAVASLVLLPFAMLPALAWPSAPYGVQAGLTLVLWAALVAALGLARTTRRVLVVAARRLLRVPLPDAPAGPASDRWRTPLWLLLHTALGLVGGLASGVLVIAAVSVPGGWLGGSLHVTLFAWSVPTSGVWSWLLAFGFLLLAAALCVWVAGALRWLAPRLLGPSTAELLALATERELLLAGRNRLAQELHDSIGHTLTAATIQAAVAGEVLAADPVAAKAAMRSIEESTRAALEDLDYVLGVLREEEAGTAPTRSLADLPELLDRLRHAGAVVEPQLSGAWEQVQGTLSRVAYRILQEGLTNALRHGTGGPIRVRVAAGSDGLELDVVNRTDGIPKRKTFPTSGHGLTGLAERVRLLHGDFEAGPTGDQQWHLSVRLPAQLPA